MKTLRRLTNREIARLLDSVAAAYEIKKESPFRIKAYQEAAVAVEHATSSLKDLWDDHKLESLPGIGPGLSQHLDELFRTGRVRHFEKVMAGLPPAMFELLPLPGVGAKTAWKLCEKLKIYHAKDALKKLALALKDGRVLRLEGFGPESEANLLAAIDQLSPHQERLLLFRADLLANDLITYLQKNPAVIRVDPLGSLRRRCATVGDLDLAVATRFPEKVIAYFLAYPKAQKTLAAGQNTARLLLANGYQVDLKTQLPGAYGALLQHFTGSKHHNIHLRKIALKKGLSLSEYGVKKGSRRLFFTGEKSFYAALGLVWIPPELREDQGEIEAAQTKVLPVLVKQGEVKGDLHLHSDFPIEPSHDLGRSSMAAMISKATALNYEYLAFSEHNPSFSRHSSDQIVKLIIDKKKLVDHLNCSDNKDTHQPHVFNSLEIDIRPDGQLAFPEPAFNYLDFAIASVHGNFGLTREQMTARVLRGLSHPKVKILGHPTGRLLDKREGYELDWDQIFAFCLKNNKALEINACPYRLDLPDILVREAVKRGVKIVINTDAHGLEEMDWLDHGLSVARRGWVQKKDLLNSWNYARIKKWLIN